MLSLAEGRPVDSVANAIPWMNYNAIEFLDERLNKNLTLFEFGSGYSTYFYASRVKAVVSVEYDDRWYQLVSAG